MNERPSAAVLLVGNELLSGRVEDRNLAFLARELWAMGIRVERAAVIRDEVETIASELRLLASRHTYVFTTGGVGPTHDDVTIAGVARAFQRQVVEHPLLAGRIRGHFGARTSEAHLRMARVPEGAELVGGEHAWPTIHVENVFVLPGVPSILERKFSDLKLRLAGGPAPLRRMVRFSAEEATIAAVLDDLAAAHPSVEIGSYPDAEGVLVTIEGAETGSVEEVESSLRDKTRELLG